MNDNSNKYALAALKDKRAGFAGEIIDFKKKIKWREDQIRHIDATIDVFEPGFDVDTVRPKRPRKRVKLFKQGELGRMIMDALRRAGKPITTYEVVTAIIDEMGHGEAARSALSQRVRGNLAYHETKTGNILKVGAGTNVRWRLA
ncbi:MAG: hypothetical protein DHS20C05_10880 [Hyphococcus sp.]|nr:MAG: hypothetical protein DHS20C05_10880 [Marinicaulis sp.]